ncbi:MAG: GGDEF and EAL domain-containing protein [Bryobacteraceae bacterium]|nr:GGDEF and EAL domain-containing protein [Bryobacteraceae bacterium]
MTKINETGIIDTTIAAGSPQWQETSLALSPLVLLSALEDPNNGLLIFDLQLRVMHATSQIWSMLDVNFEEPITSPEILQLLSRSALDAASVATAKDVILAFLAGGGKADGVLLRNKDGSRGLRMRLRSLGPEYFAASFESVLPDVAPGPPASASEDRDWLTGLATRACFENALQQALNRVPQTPVSVLLLDLDRFKAVNDTLGHAAGDRLLRLLSDRLKSLTRKSNLVARFGGDEFAILIDPSPTREVPIGIAKRILDLAQRTYLIDGQLANVGTSIGIAQSPGDGADGQTLVRNADLALYQAKETGRGAYLFFDPSMERRALDRRTSELELRKALALRQLEVHYQPQVNTVTGRLVGFEALLRWRHPERGLLMPGSFLPIAEEVGVIVPIGEWVLRTACREALKWPENIVIAVNASPLQFDTGKFTETVRHALQITGLPGERLEIEITEGILLRNSDMIMKTLHDLRAMKVRIAMDDFGTGYASLSQLAQFPFDTIKIDRSLTGFEGDDVKQRSVVRAITALGQSLGVCTLAEGVETAEQLARLQMDGCDSLQGYLFGKAVPPSELDDVISRLCSPEGTTMVKAED